jgi:hypothetical protein
MTWFRKKPDPLSDKARMLNTEIAQLEVQIKRLDAQLQRNQPDSSSVPTVVSAQTSPAHNSNSAAARSRLPRIYHEPIFEQVSTDRLAAPQDNGNSPEHYNELGVRKYDLPALFARMRRHFNGPATTNPKLVSYLAAGGLQGLRPLRYEKRVARNRFIVLFITLFLVLLGLIWAFVHNQR